MFKKIQVGGCSHFSYDSPRSISNHTLLKNMCPIKMRNQIRHKYNDQLYDAKGPLQLFERNSSEWH